MRETFDFKMNTQQQCETIVRAIYVWLHVNRPDVRFDLQRWLTNMARAKTFSAGDACESVADCVASVFDIDLVKYLYKEGYLGHARIFTAVFNVAKRLLSVDSMEELEKLTIHAGKVQNEKNAFEYYLRALMEIAKVYHLYAKDPSNNSDFGYSYEVRVARRAQYKRSILNQYLRRNAERLTSLGICYIANMMLTNYAPFVRVLGSIVESRGDLDENYAIFLKIRYNEVKSEYFL